MKTLRVAALQTGPEFGNLSHNLHDAIGLIPSACDLAVLPELFATGYQFRDRDEVRHYAEDLSGRNDGPVTRRLTEVARASGTTLVAGLAECAGDRLFNSAVLIRPDGTRGVYRKIHLFMDEKNLFDPGDLGFPVFEACGTTVGLMVCFDWMFPEAARSLALGGARLIAHPSNLVLPGCPAAMVTRSQENRVVSVTSNRVGRENRTGTPLEFIGLSQIVMPDGECLDQVPGGRTGAAVAEISLAGTNKLVTPRNDLWEDRRPDQYRTDPTG